MSWNKPKDASHLEKRTGARFPVPVLRGAVAALIVVVAGAIVAWLFVGGEARKDSPTADAIIQSVHAKDAKAVNGVGNDASRRNVSTAVRAADAAVEEQPDKREDISSKRKDEPVVLSCSTNSSGYIMTTLKLPNGRTRLCVKEVPSIWKNGTDAMIALAAFTPEDMELPPWPPMDGYEEQKFLDSIGKPIEVLPTDSPEIREKKKIVESMRSEILKMMDEEDLSFAEVLERHRELANHNAQMKLMATIEYNRILESGDAEGAEVYREAANAVNAKTGISEIKQYKPEDDQVE